MTIPKTSIGCRGFEAETTGVAKGTNPFVSACNLPVAIGTSPHLLTNFFIRQRDSTQACESSYEFTVWRVLL